MQKHILCIYILLHTFLSGMEQYNYQPPICIQNTDDNCLDSLLTLLSERHPDILYIGLSSKDVLSHQSKNAPEAKLLTTVHSEHYLDNIQKHPSIMRSAITNTLLPALYPNKWSHSYFDDMLTQCAVTTVATKVLIDQIDEKKQLPPYIISLSEAHSFAGYEQSDHGNAYGAIPMAATYALNTETIRRLLVIDENLGKKEEIEKYYKQGNGSIFFSTDNKLSQIFDNKVIVLKEMPAETLWKSFTDPRNVMHEMIINKDIPVQNILNFINNYHQPIDLAFYNINIEDSNINITTRLTSIASMINKFIPTVFILSGDKNKYKETASILIDYLMNVIKLCTATDASRLASLASKSTESSSSEQFIDSSDSDTYSEEEENNDNESKES